MTRFNEGTFRVLTTAVRESQLDRGFLCRVSVVKNYEGYKHIV